jgi:hypothetical protein
VFLPKQQAEKESESKNKMILSKPSKKTADR